MSRKCHPSQVGTTVWGEMEAPLVPFNSLQSIALERVGQCALRPLKPLRCDLKPVTSLWSPGCWMSFAKNIWLVDSVGRLPFCRSLVAYGTGFGFRRAVGFSANVNLLISQTGRFILSNVEQSWDGAQVVCNFKIMFSYSRILFVRIARGWAHQRARLWLSNAGLLIKCRRVCESQMRGGV